MMLRHYIGATLFLVGIAAVLLGGIAAYSSELSPIVCIAGAGIGALGCWIGGWIERDVD